MPRPATKAALLDAIQKESSALEAMLSTLSPDQMVQPDIVGPWSVKDVLAHLVAWSAMCLDWYATGKRGEMPETPAPGLTWRQIPELNERIYQEHKDDPLDATLAAWRESVGDMRSATEQASSDELFSPGHNPWTKSTTLCSYFVSASSSHYLWARNEIRKGLKAKGAAAT